ncbi:hypothetical protein FOXYS1_6872 [Fusarium oxysporum]|uniref:PPPDE domain-containing protein n=1 Tax=Fusarium oxysporum TaxID=5507 RepID=A0A8H5ABV9_FUSOX|nr:hypothetical protein FOXYS1_6872 [Fusarium oxysporum]
MDLESIWQHLKEVSGATASPAQSFTDPSTGAIFPIIKNLLRHPLQKLGVAGKQENMIPPTLPSKSNPPREVLLGSHVVTGMIAKLIGALTPQTRVLPITFSSNPAPDPTHHWAILVGDYYHELSSDLDWIILYNNDKTSAQTFLGGWEKPMLIGKTTFNDEAIRQAAEDVIKAMVPEYNVYNNNCQLFCMNLADVICDGGHATPTTSWQMIPALQSEPAKRVREIALKYTPFISPVQMA